MNVMADKESELQDAIQKRRAAMVEAEEVMMDKMGQLSKQVQLLAALRNSL